MMNIGTFSNDTKSLLERHKIQCELLSNNKSNIDTLISGRLTKEQLNGLPQLRQVIVPYSGLNGLCLADLKERNILVYNLNFHSHFVAEKALTLALSLLGNIISYHNNLKKGYWSDRQSDDRIYWESLFHKKVGIYGYGNIGKELHKLLIPFQSEIFIIDRNKKYDNVSYVKDLSELFHKTDIVFVTVPLNKTTEGSINQSVLNYADGKYLINVSRGKVIEESALFEALSNNVLKGFASDVWYVYPKKDELVFPSIYPIDEFDNVVMSPHSGGFTKDSSRLREEALLNLIRSLEQNENIKSIEINKYL